MPGSCASRCTAGVGDAADDGERRRRARPARIERQDLAAEEHARASTFGSQSIEPVNTDARRARRARGRRGEVGWCRRRSGSPTTGAVRLAADRAAAACRDRHPTRPARDRSGPACGLRSAASAATAAGRAACRSQPVSVSACRRQISASTLCVKSTAGHGRRRGRFTAGTRKSHTTRS